MSLQSIEDIIENVPFMDTKNISKIIESYKKYNIIKEYELKILKLELETMYDSDYEYSYCIINNCYYLLNRHHSFLTLINNKMCLNGVETRIVPAYEEPDNKYFFISYFINGDEHFISYSILKKFKNKKEFCKDLRKELLTYKELFINGIFPSSHEDFEYLKLTYYNQEIFRVHKCDDEDESYKELKEKGKILQSIIDKIVNLFN